MSVHQIVRQIIDRDCHVSMPNREVVRHVISKLREGYTTFRTMPRADRRRLIEDCLKQHRANIDLYRSVMSGQPTRKRSRRLSESENSLPPGRLSGKELCRLMRKHKVTIATLSFRTGITQKRIRAARESGLNDAMAVRDWVQAITGADSGPIPEKYPIRNRTEETTCDYCGCPLFVGEDAFEYVNEVFCSRHCCRKSRGWC
jgi:hypothetical protein